MPDASFVIDTGSTSIGVTMNIKTNLLLAAIILGGFFAAQELSATKPEQVTALKQPLSPVCPQAEQ